MTIRTCNFCTRLGCKACDMPIPKRTRVSYTKDKQKQAEGSAKQRELVRERQCTIAYARHEIATRDWDGTVDYFESSGQIIPKHIRLGRVPYIKGK